MTAEAPRVFISYSHDSPQHKQWVALLATRLRQEGVDATLDQWDLGLGDDVTLFMESGVTNAQRVLVVCTDEYVRKADAGKGGVGYERLIVTAELVNNLGTNKFIPVIRQASGGQKTPKFLGTRLSIDFRNDDEFEARFEELLRELHQSPSLEKPAIGKNPFARTRAGDPAAPQPAVAVALPDGGADPVEVYRAAVELARRGDLLGWRQLVKKVRGPERRLLLAWMEEHVARVRHIDDSFVAAVDEAVSHVAPLFALALAGVESGRSELRDQRSVVDDITNIGGWVRSGLTAIVDLPRTLCYVYQALHGAVCVNTAQLELALDLADVKIEARNTRDLRSLWKQSDIVGFPESLGGDYRKAWNFLTEGAERWPWVLEVFGSEEDYRTALAAYYLALNVYEAVDDIAQGKVTEYQQGNTAGFHTAVPLAFTLESDEIQNRAVRLLIRNPSEFAKLWERKGVTRADVERFWPEWVKLCSTYLSRRSGRFLGDRLMPHERVFQMI